MMGFRWKIGCYQFSKNIMVAPSLLEILHNVLTSHVVDIHAKYAIQIECKTGK